MARIFILDDSALIRRRTCAALARGGHQLLDADPPTLVEALQRIREWVPDLLVLDYSLPDHDYDGLKLLRRLRLSGSPLPVILLSANQEPEVLAKFWEEEVNAILPKPEGLNILPEVAQRVLEGLGSARASR